MATENRILNYTVKVSEKDLNKHLSKIDKITKKIILTSYSTINKVSNLVNSIDSELIENLRNIEEICINIKNQAIGISESYKRISNEIASTANQVSNFSNNSSLAIGNISQKIEEYNRKIANSKKMMNQLFVLSNQEVKNKKGTNSNMFGKGDSINSKSNSSLNYIKLTNSESSKLDTTLEGLGETLDTSINIFSLFADLAGVAVILLEGTSVAASLASAGIAALAIGTIAGLSNAFIQYSGYTTEASELNKKHRDSIKEINDALREGKELSANNYQSGLNSLFLPQQYASEIKKLVDDKGNLIGDKDSLMNAVNAFNSSMGLNLFYYDEESSKLKSLNGEIENVGKTIDNIILKSRGESFVNSYMGIYQQNSQALEALEINKQEKKDAIKAIEDKYIKDSIDIAKVVDFLDKNNTDQYTTIKKLSEMGVNANLLEDVGFTTDLSDFKGLKMELEALNLETDKIEIFKSKFEDFYKALVNNDFDTVEGFLNGNMMLNDLNNLDLLIERIRFAKDELMEVRLEAENGTKSEEDVQKSKENVDMLLQQFKLETNLDFDEVEKQAALSGELYGSNYTEKIKTAMKAMNGEMLMNTGMTMIQNLALISGAVISYVPPSIIIPVKFDILDNPFGLLFPLIDSSFDDSLEGSVIQPNWSSEAIKSSHLMLNSLQQRIVPTISVGIPTLDINLDKGNSTAVTQNINFNQPIQKPSDVTRAMQKASRNLRKVK